MFFRRENKDLARWEKLRRDIRSNLKYNYFAAQESFYLTFDLNVIRQAIDNLSDIKDVNDWILVMEGKGKGNGRTEFILINGFIESFIYNLVLGNKLYFESKFYKLIEVLLHSNWIDSVFDNRKNFYLALDLTINNFHESFKESPNYFRICSIINEFHDISKKLISKRDKLIEIQKEKQIEEINKERIKLDRLVCEIDSAILNGKKITFNYQDRFGNHSIRMVLPLKKTFYGESLCVEGYCFLREEDRVFKLMNITNLESK